MSKRVAINDLALMVANGFADIQKNMATKAELNALSEKVSSMEIRMNRRFRKIELQLYGIQSILIENHLPRIVAIEKALIAEGIVAKLKR